MKTNKEISEYYKLLTLSYKRYAVCTNNIHYGFHETGQESHPQVLEKMNAVLAQIAEVNPNDTILDAGCGLGGSSVWLAKTFGCRVIGITLCKEHISLAENFAREHHVAHLVNFSCQDFTNTRFESSSFDLVWGLESICYAQEKEAFIQEASRLLKPGGRIVIADGFLKEKRLSMSENQLIYDWMTGWAVPNVISFKEFVTHLKNYHFTILKTDDITPNVLRTSHNMYRISKVVYPISKFMATVGLWSDKVVNHWRSGVLQYHIFTGGISLYGVILAQKSS